MGLALDANLTLLLDAKLTGFSRLSGNAKLMGSRLMQSVKLLRLTFDDSVSIASSLSTRPLWFLYDEIRVWVEIPFSRLI